MSCDCGYVPLYCLKEKEKVKSRKIDKKKKIKIKY